MSQGVTLLSNASATGGAIAAGPGDYCYAVDGTFGSGTVSLQMQSPDGSSWLTIADTSLTAEGAVIVTLPRGIYRAGVSGGTPSALYATLLPVA